MVKRKKKRKSETYRNMSCHTIQQSHSWAYAQTKLLIQKHTRTPVFTAALVYNSRDMDITSGSISRWLGKEDACVCTHSQCNTTLKKRANAACSSTDGLRDDQAEWRSPERERQVPYVESKIRHKSTYLWNTHRYREQTCSYQGRGEGVGEGGFRVQD